TGQVVLQVQGEEWTTDPADWDDPAAGPLELLIAGVRVRVVSIDPPAGGVQQITVTRVSDVPRVAPAGAAVDLADARPWALSGGCMAWPPRAGQTARASDFRKMPGVGYVRQGADQSVTSTSVVDSSIVVPVDGLITVRLSARWSSGGGGIRWTWSGAGDVSLLAREIVSAGRDATGNIHELTTMRHRQQLTLAEEQEVNHISPATSYLIQELLI